MKNIHDLCDLLLNYQEILKLTKSTRDSKAISKLINSLEVYGHLTLEEMIGRISQEKVDISNYKTILLYNQYRGENHSFKLLKSC